MTERTFRLILGVALLLFLYMHWDIAVYGYIGLVLFEGITNFRIPILVSRLRYGNQYQSVDSLSPDCSRIPFDAERALRLLIALTLIVTFVMFPAAVWFFPWFVGAMLTMAGITNICPMVMALRWMGLR